MDQTEARRLARSIGGVATQRSRIAGQFAQPGEPWVVHLPDGRIVDEPPAPDPAACTCLSYAAGGDGPEVDCPVHGDPELTAAPDLAPGVYADPWLDPDAAARAVPPPF